MNFGSLDAIVDTHDQFTLEGAPRAWVVILFFEEIANFLEKVCIFAPTSRNHKLK